MSKLGRISVRGLYGMTGGNGWEDQSEDVTSRIPSIGSVNPANYLVGVRNYGQELNELTRIPFRWGGLPNLSQLVARGKGWKP